MERRAIARHFSTYLGHDIFTDDSDDESLDSEAELPGGGCLEVTAFSQRTSRQILLLILLVYELHAYCSIHQR